MSVGNNFYRFGIFLLMLMLVGCGTFEIGIESTRMPKPVIDNSKDHPTTNAPTAQITPSPSATSPTLTPTAPTETPVAGRVYRNSVFNISLTYPAEWEAVPGYTTYGDRFSGSNGFFTITGAGGDNIDTIVGSEADHRLRPYGQNPIIEITQIQGQPARFIWPSLDASLEGQAALFVRMPEPVMITGNTYDFLVLYADQEHMRSLAQSLRFMGTSSASEPEVDFWTAAGTSSDRLVALLLRTEAGLSRYGDIATMNADGTDLNQITTYNYNADPVLSPNGRRVAYRSVPISITSLPDPGSRLFMDLYNIWVITTDGSKAWQLTQSEDTRSIPTWSADSSRVAFSQGAIGELIEIEVDTQFSRLITQGAFSPRYRPDGGGIGYITNGRGLAWIDNNGIENIILSPDDLPEDTTVNDFDWLPDGRHILFTTVQGSGKTPPENTYSLYIVPIDGLSSTLLAEGVRSVRVSPDGRTIAGLRGTGFGDACFVDSQLIFMHLATDLESVEITSMETFSGYPETGVDQFFYPLSNVTWVSDRLAMTEFDLTCTADRQSAGRYVIDPLAEQMVQVTGTDFE